MTDMTEIRRSAEAELDGRATSQESELLHDHVEEWYLALVDLIQTIDQQGREREAALESRRLDLYETLEPVQAQKIHARERAEYLTLRGKSMGSKQNVQRKLSEVKLERNRARDERYALRLNAEFYALTQAVERHEAEVRGSGREPSDTDRSLWAASSVSARALDRE